MIVMGRPGMDLPSRRRRARGSNARTELSRELRHEGRELRHEGDPVRCWVWTLDGCNYCGVQ
jgi:hypothetical protein